MHIWKTVKIFISSTFKDLESERDELARIFRQLQQDVYERQLHLISYDLRWKERRIDQSLVSWCLEMVDQSQYFVGIVGKRYGWRPEFDQYGEKNKNNISITEMEINRALKTIPKEKRFFCLAKSQNNETLSKDQSSLEKLKKKLQDMGEIIFLYSSSAELVEIINNQLKKKIDHDFPPHQKVAPLQHTPQDALREIIDEKIKGFIGRNKYIKIMDEFVYEQKEVNHLVVEAVAGTGKSALLAQFLQSSKQPFVAHYMNMAGDSRSRLGILQSIAEQLQNLGHISDSLQLSSESLTTQIQDTIQNNKEPLLIAIDGIDEMEEMDLSWLPKKLPIETKVIITTRPIAQSENFPHAQKINLSPLSQMEIDQIITDYENDNEWNLSREERGILSTRAAGNPLFLKVSLDEMSAGGVAVGQLAQTVESLFRQVLQRLQEEYGVTRINDYLGVIAASRYGLAEAELHEIFSSRSNEQASDNFLVMLHKSLSHFVVVREQLLNFFHPEFERSIKMQLGKSGMRKCHQILAEYFKTKGIFYKRALLEIPYQLQWAEQQEELLKVLGDIVFLEEKCKEMVVDLNYDLEMAIHHEEVGIPSNLEVTICKDVKISKRLIELMQRIIQMDIQFLQRNGKHLFQCLWNRGFWHDSPEAEKHYINVQKKPWEQPGPKLYKLVEHWKNQKQNMGKWKWIQTLRPLPLRLDSPLLKTFRGHKEEIMSVCITSDGKKIVSGAQDNQIKVWDTENGKCLLTIKGHENIIRDVYISDDDKKIISASEDKTIRVWNITTGAELLLIEQYDDCIKTIFVKKNKIVSGGRNGRVCLWDLDTGECQFSFRTGKFTITAVSITSDLQTIIATNSNKTICFREVEKKENIVLSQSATTHSLFVKSNIAIVGMENGKISLWDIKKRKRESTFQAHRSTIDSICMDNKNHIITASWDKTIGIWKMQDSSHVSYLKGHEEWVSSVASYQNLIISTSYDNTVRIWNNATETLSLNLQGHKDNIESVYTKNDGQETVSSATATIGVWNNHNNQFYDLKENDTVESVFFHESGKIIAGLDNGIISIWDSNTKNNFLQLKGHKGMIWCVHSDKYYIASGSSDETVRLWDIKQAKSILTIKGHNDHVTAVCIDSDAQLLISGGSYVDKSILVWDIDKKKCICRLHGHKSAIIDLSIIDKNTIVSTSYDKTIRIWNIKEEKYTKVIKGIAKTKQWKQTQNFYALTQESESIVVNENKNEKIPFPAIIEQIDMSKTGIITGKIADYLYLLQLRE